MSQSHGGVPASISELLWEIAYVALGVGAVILLILFAIGICHG